MNETQVTATRILAIIAEIRSWYCEYIPEESRHKHENVRFALDRVSQNIRSEFDLSPHLVPGAPTAAEIKSSFMSKKDSCI